MKAYTVFYIILPFCVACRDGSAKTPQSKPPSNPVKNYPIKPPTSYSDTLKIDSKAAIFYYPDSVQLEKLRAASDTSKFDAVMHESFYQFRYIHIVLNKYWPGIPVIEAKKIRYLLFIKADKSRVMIDLNTKNDPHGLIVFDPQKDPSQLEMTNAESELGFYFSENGPQKTK